MKTTIIGKEINLKTWILLETMQNNACVFILLPIFRVFK